MPRYSVIVTRDTTESTTVLVTAPSSSAAQIKAVDLTHRADFKGKWEQDYTPNASKEHYTNDAEEIL